MTVTGTIEVSKNRVVLKIDDNICEYYKRLIEKEFPNLKGGLSTSRHGAHVSISQDGKHIIDNNKALWFNGEIVAVDIDFREIYLGGFRKGFVGFYVKVRSKRLRRIQNTVVKKFLTDTRDFHLTICTTKGILKS